MSARARQLLLLLGLVLVAVVVGRGIYEVGLALHLLGGGAVETAPSAPDEPGDGRSEGLLPAEPPDGVPAPAQGALVDRVVDGDTLRVTVEQPGGDIGPTDAVRVRLLTIDAPELDHPERGRDCGAVEATDLLEELTPPGSVVWLVADVEDRDRYDRPLRGVFADDGTFVNAELVAAGWAEVALFEPNDRFHEHLLAVEEAARREGRGAWTACDGFPP
jgi:micrococcal nuclease